MSYVEHGGLASPPGPLKCQDATIWGFWVRADKDALARECERVFERPSGGAVRCDPVAPAALLLFARLGQVSSLSWPYTQVGNVPERETAVLVPVVVRSRRAPRPLPAPRRRFPNRIAELTRVRFAAFVTYMFLDNPMSIAAGREIYGYPKNWGWSTFPDDAQTPPEGQPARPPDVPLGSLALDAFAIPQFAPLAMPARHRLLTLHPAEPCAAPSAGARRVVALNSAAELAQWSRQRVAGTAGGSRRLNEAASRILARWLPPLAVSQLFIRQLRAAGGGLGADFQQILTAPATVTRWNGAVTLPRHELTIGHLDSHPISDDLGIEDGHTLAEFRAQFDFSVGPATSLWTARSPGLRRRA